ncbi:hypothetical protein KRMM14A1259_09210 [Krasilnikovia sp. MM14-A1259]
MTGEDAGPTAAADERAARLRQFLRWLGSVLDQVRLPGAALAVFIAALIVPAIYHDMTSTVLLEYQEDGRPMKLRADDGCLELQRSRRERVTYCPALMPVGADGWAPQLMDYYAVDAAQRSATEVVQFGIVPDQVVRVRSTLPGGHALEADARRVPGIDHPVVLLHLSGVAYPVDMAQTEGRRVFVRQQMFDAAGREVPLV